MIGRPTCEGNATKNRFLPIFFLHCICCFDGYVNVSASLFLTGRSVGI
jgi:hypothetical protein